MKRLKKGLVLAAIAVMVAALAGVAIADHPSTTTLTVSPASPTFEGTAKSFSGTVSGHNQADQGTVTIKRYGSSTDCAADTSGVVVATASGTAWTSGTPDSYGPVGSDDPSAGNYWYKAFFAPHQHPIAGASSCIAHVVNVPTLTSDAGGPYSGAEGSAIALNGDALFETGATTFAWTVDTTTPTPGDAGVGCSFSPNNTSEDPSITCTDDGVFTLTLAVTDTVAGPVTDTATLTVTNANPVVDITGVTQSGCDVNLDATFSDAGTNDTHQVTIDWGDTNPDTVLASPASSPIDQTHTYVPGTYTILVTALDDDGGSGSDSEVGFEVKGPMVVDFPMSPLNGQSFNIGSVVPIKVSIDGCTNPIPTVNIAIVSPSGTAVSAGNSSPDDEMRYSPDLPGFIYNWQTKGLTAGPYTIDIDGVGVDIDETVVITLVKKGK